jgi:hypothetical protein
MEKIYKVSFNLNTKDHIVLENMALEKNVSQADIIREVLAYQKFINDVIKHEGKFLIEDENHDLHRVIFN